MPTPIARGHQPQSEVTRSRCTPQRQCPSSRTIRPQADASLQRNTKATRFLTIVCLLATGHGCSNGTQATSRLAAAEDPAVIDTPTHEADAAHEAAARELLAALSGGSFAEATAMLSDELLAKLPPEALKNGWRSLATQVGELQDVVATKAEPSAAGEVVTLTLAMERSRINMVVAFDAQGRVSGLHLVPAPAATPAPSSGPSYADASSFIESAMQLEGLPADAVEQVKQLSAELQALEDPQFSVKSEPVMGVPASYWVDLLEHDVVELAATQELPMLILQGERDYQVTKADFARWQRGLASRKGVTYRSYPDLNHLFMVGSGPPSPAEYDRPNHVAVAVIDDIAQWIQTHAR